MSYVALDLETTGLDPDADEIIEVAAVRFDANGVIDTYQSLVNPDRKLEYRIALLTGIAAEDLERAPHFASIAGDVAAFIGLDPVVGQNPTFDTGFLARKGVHVLGPTYDTYELASLLLPELRQHTLGAIADHLSIEFTGRHRAMADADAARQVFAALRERLAASPPDVLAEAARISAASPWPLKHLFAEVAAERPRRPGDGERDGVVHGFVKTPPPQAEPMSPSTRPVPVPPESAAALIASGAARDSIDEFEERPEQASMTRAVAEAIAEGDRLIVEAGTGVGKALAYLVPAALSTMRNSTRAIISTNTINLQDQLMRQDIPVMRRILAGAGIDGDDLQVAQLKGRRNYLCLLRWASAGRTGTIGADEAHVLVRLLFWLGHTDTGDRAELNLRREEDAPWARLSAQEGGCLAAQCLYVRDGSCFLYRARKRAESAHLVVVNHALLLSDVRAAGNVLPPYQHLIVDEAHHLEDEATSQFGFAASESDLMSWLDRLFTRVARDREGGFVATIFTATRASQQAVGPAPQLQALARDLMPAVTRARDRAPLFFRALLEFGQQHSAGRNDYDERIMINRAMRVQPDWSDVEANWFEVDEILAQVMGLVDDLQAALLQAATLDIVDRDAAVAEASELYDEGEQLRTGLSRIIGRDDREAICWLTMPRRDASPSLASAPLSVSETLRAALFGSKDSVVLTSATLTTDGNFDYIKGRLGIEDARELLLGSPFDYPNSTLILAPTDMPEPNQQAYLGAVQAALIDLVRASDGRALVLFTSHSALRAAYQGIKRQLEEQQILVLGQGIDGTPRQLLATLRDSHRTVLLGASSFWEGVDVTGEALSLLVIARLPFSVPSDPVFQARSDLFEAPFEQYAVPQAILRFKQGFGRLIRRKTDRGVMVVLDRRLLSKRYGPSFVRSLPDCELREVPLRGLASEVSDWLGRPQAAVKP
jgi:predicted DnaQ family exonuclease/DinG family helicase